MMHTKWAALSIALAFALFSLLGCTSLKLAKYERRAAAFEAAQPNAEELALGELTSTLEIVENINDWGAHLEVQGLPKKDVARLIARYKKAQQRYLLAAAELANTPDLAFYLTILAIPPSHGNDAASVPDEIMEMAESYAQARALPRHALLEASGTYAYEDTPNCVFSHHPFAEEGELNSELSFYFSGESQTMHARCYLSTPMSGLKGDGVFVVSVVGGSGLESFQKVIAARRDFEPERHYVDFVLDANDRFVHPDANFAVLSVSVLYERGSGGVLVLDSEGQLGVLEDIKRTPLAGSKLLWRL